MFPWNTRVLLCAGSQLYSQIDRWSLVISDMTLSFSSAVLYVVVHEILCEYCRQFVISNVKRDLAFQQHKKKDFASNDKFSHSLAFGKTLSNQGVKR